MRPSMTRLQHLLHLRIVRFPVASRLRRRQAGAIVFPAEMTVKTRIIVNPMANKGCCGKRWPQIRAELEKHLGPIDDHHIAMTRERNHAMALAQEAAAAGYRRLVSVGGDGTFSEVLNGVI